MFTRVKRFVPVSTPPITFYLKSTCTFLNHVKGWKCYRVVIRPGLVDYFWTCGGHIYRQV